MKTIYKQSFHGFNTTATEAAEGNKFFSMGNPSLNGKYIVVWDYSDKSGQGKQYFDSYAEAIQFASFQAQQQRYAVARNSGLNHEYATLVMNRKITLESALGDMDVTAESDEMEYADFYSPADFGGEDDATPPMAVLLAGGEYEYNRQMEQIDKDSSFTSRY